MFMNHKKSIAHFQGREQQLLFRIKNVLVDQVQPLIIYLLGCQIMSNSKRNCFLQPQRTDTWQFSCDLLLILPEGKDMPADMAANLICCSPDLADVRLMSYSLAFMQQQIKDRFLFFNWVRRSGIVLYEKGEVLGQLPPRLPKHNAYAHQAARYYLAHPDYAHHLDEKLAALPAKPDPEASDTIIPLQLGIKDGALVVLTKAKK